MPKRVWHQDSKRLQSKRCCFAPPALRSGVSHQGLRSLGYQSEFGTKTPNACRASDDVSPLRRSGLAFHTRVSGRLQGMNRRYDH